MEALGLQANAYLEGEAYGILSLVTVQNNWLESNDVISLLSYQYRDALLSKLYKQALLDVGKTEEDADYWVKFFLEPKE